MHRAIRRKVICSRMNRMNIGKLLAPLNVHISQMKAYVFMHIMSLSMSVISISENKLMKQHLLVRCISSCCHIDLRWAK
ncbi:hypothetical protein RRG08_063178 [Elysia crispata]|uniref:Uncharacterized protein n=1 Tax=Elysia crispata TaxID=231223 RepID=A0AAE0YUZ9_9GAST|nr:hypothetical protein RRG08_063178 [Elysia crispata]